MRCASRSRAGSRPHAPRAAPPPVRRRSHHGIERVDDYAWLRAVELAGGDARPRAARSAIRAHLEAENAYTEAAMADTEALQAALFAEMKARIKEDDARSPLPTAPSPITSRFVTGGQHPLFCRTTARRRRGADPARRQRACRSRMLISASPASPTAPTTAHRLRRRHQGLRVLHRQHHRRRHRRAARCHASPTPTERSNGRADSREPALCLGRRRAPSAQRATATRSARTSPDALIHEQKDPGFFLGVGATQDRALPPAQRARPRDRRDQPDRCRRSCQRPRVWSRRASPSTIIRSSIMTGASSS